MKGKVLVTGATGLLGSHLVRKLLEKGYPVRALKRKESDTSRLGKYAQHVEWIEGDVLNYNSLVQALKGVEGVFHCAARVSFRPADKELMFETNVIGTRNMINASLDYGNLKFFVHVSSVAALGRTINGIPIDEEAEWDPAHYPSDYSYTKWLSEKEAWRGFAEGLPVVIVNPSVILGRGNWYTDSSQLFAMIDKKFPFYPVGGTGFVDAYDVAKIMIELGERGITGERFILSAENWLHRDIMAYIAMEMGCPIPFIPAILPIRILALVADATRILRGKKRRLSWKLLKQSSKRLYYDNRKIRFTLNYQFESIRNTVKRIVQDYLSGGWQ